MNIAYLPSLFVVAVVTIACNTSSSEEPEPEVVIEGAFRLEAESQSATIDEIAFRDGHYWLVPKGCADESCRERGTFALDRANHFLELVVDGTGRAYRLPFEVTSTRRDPGATGARPASVAGQLAPTADSLVGGSDQLVGQSQLIVGSFKLLEDSYSEDYDNCLGSTNDALRIAIAICGSNKEPTKSPRIKCILMNDQDHCNGASKQSCLQDTEKNDALSRYDQYSKDCRDSGDIARETEASFNNGLNKFVMTVCCKTYTCADGVRLDGTAVTGKRGETVCGTNAKKWWCGPGGKTEGVGEWKPLATPCSG